MVIDQKLIYIKTTVALAILTLIEIGVSYWDLPRFNQIRCLIDIQRPSPQHFALTRINTDQRLYIPLAKITLSRRGRVGLKTI